MTQIFHYLHKGDTHKRVFNIKEGEEGRNGKINENKTDK
jgi:hypothetical protein